MTKPATVAQQRLKSFVERLERMEEERKAISGDIRDIYAEAKGVGYDVKTLRWLLQERKVDVADRDERDQLRDTYALALGMAVNLVQIEGLSLREAARQSGMSKSSIHRALAVPAVSHETVPPVEMGAEPKAEHATDSQEDSVLSGRGERSDEISNAAPEGCVDGPSVFVLPETIVPPSATPQTDDAANSSVTPVPDEGVGAGTSSEQEAPAALEGDVKIDGLSPETARKFNKIGPPVVTSTSDDPAGPIPSFLRRNGVATRKSATPRGGSDRSEGTQ